MGTYRLAATSPLLVVSGVVTPLTVFLYSEFTGTRILDLMHRNMFGFPRAVRAVWTSESSVVRVAFSSTQHGS